MKNCCGNCEWSISSEDEENIMKEMGYDEEDINRPHAGDCCIGNQDVRVDYYCKEHIYNSGLIYGIDDEIMNNSSHSFVYSYDGNARDAFIEEMCLKYPIVVNKNTPIAIDVKDFMVTNDNKINESNLHRLKLLSLEYLNMSICYNITKSIIDNNVENIDLLLSKINQLFLNDNSEEIKNIDELLDELNNSMSFYKECYSDILNNKVNDFKIEKLRIPFIRAETYIKIVKKAINNSSYFALLFNCENAPFIVCNTLNSFISSRINRDISMKVLCDFNSYRPLYDINNNLIQNIHDYNIIELDDNYSDSLSLIKKNTNRFE